MCKCDCGSSIGCEQFGGILKIVRKGVAWVLLLATFAVAALGSGESIAFATTDDNANTYVEVSEKEVTLKHSKPSSIRSRFE